MTKKLLLVFMIIIMCVSCVSCSNGEDEVVETERWTGLFMWENEETGEFKVLEANAVDDITVGFLMESSRGSEEFQAQTKSKSGRYLVVNLGQKTLKITISTDGEVITVDDMWTDDITLREENWTGKYHRLLYGQEVPQFGNKEWNGKYTNAETGLEISTYGIREGFVLFSYKGMNEDWEEETLHFMCLEPEAKKAVFTKDERLILLEIQANKRIKVTDLYMNDSENKGISGIYKRN